MSDPDVTPAPFKKQAIHIKGVSEGKAIELLAKTDILTAGVQIVSAKGGETNLHAHAGTDQFYVVLQGQATFYRSVDEVAARLDKNDTLLIPRATPYWFESSGSEDLVILRLGAKAAGVEDKRTNYTERKREGTVVA